MLGQIKCPPQRVPGGGKSSPKTASWWLWRLLFLPCMRESASSSRGCGLLALVGPVTAGLVFIGCWRHGGAAALGSAAAARAVSGHRSVYWELIQLRLSALFADFWKLCCGSAGSAYRVIRLFPCQRRHHNARGTVKATPDQGAGGLGLRSEHRDSSESTNYSGPTHVVRTGDQRRETDLIAYNF